MSKKLVHVLSLQERLSLRLYPFLCTGVFFFTKCRDIDPRMSLHSCTDRLPVRIYGYITPGCTRFAAPAGFPRGFTGTLPPAVPVLLHQPASHADLRVHYPRLYPFCCTGRLPARIYGYISKPEFSAAAVTKYIIYSVRKDDIVQPY